jgi:predicted GIY-YIG superfamily endonuclease
MQELIKPHGYWTKERCHEEALKYNTKKEFQKNSSGAFMAAYKNGWLDAICEHIVEIQKPRGYWTKQRCHEEALKYNTKKEFQKNSTAYSSAQRNNWMDAICDHMTILGNTHNRYVYSYTFFDNSIYIGITCDYKRRNLEHMKDKTSQVFKYKNIINKEPIFKLLTIEPIPVDEAIDMEINLIAYYQNSNSNLLNISSGGGTGASVIKMTKERCREEAQKYNTRSEFQKNSSAYSTLQRNGWLDELCTHMQELIKPDGYWTKERCHEEALKYNNKKEFRKNVGGGYSIASHNSWLDEICGHMIELKKPSGHWTKERCHEEALKYNTKKEFQKNSTAYSRASKNKWLVSICGHMIETQKPNGYWTKQRCHVEALKYTNKTIFYKEMSGAYHRIQRNTWGKDIFSHMIETKKPNGYWTKERCHEEAMKYNTKLEFKQNAGSANTTAIKNIWMDEICSHMK